MPKSRKRGSENSEYEPWLKTGEILKMFGLSYGFISKAVKDDPDHPDRPRLNFLPVGNQMRFRPSEVKAFLIRYGAWTRSRKT